MTRLVSLIILVALVAVFGVLFFQVMVGFVIPLFIAALLTIMFRPLHRWMLTKFPTHERVAALCTTLSILLILLVPLTGLIARATADAVDFVQHMDKPQFDSKAFQAQLDRLNHQFSLDLKVKDIQQFTVEQINVLLGPLAAKTPAYIANFVIGLFVLIAALYYFLADGTSMIDGVANLFPLDNQYQQQLLDEFETVSRAVVSATLWSSIAQGLLAGIGFYFAGLNSVFLLMLLTMFGAMVPIVGAASVWGACCLWLYFIQGDTAATIGLAIYGAIIVSTVDNLIKPWVLHGQSKLHPLLGLLSVLGGVQALGPLGIFVGPMAVAFLQAGLKMLQQEMANWRTGKGPRMLAG